MECSDLLIATTLFKWYMEQEGIVCDNISKVIIYYRYQPYKAFVELGCNMRREKNNRKGGRGRESSWAGVNAPLPKSVTAEYLPQVKNLLVLLIIRIVSGTLKRNLGSEYFRKPNSEVGIRSGILINNNCVIIKMAWVRTPSSV